MNWSSVKNEFLNSTNSIEIFEKDNVTDKYNTIMEAIVNNTDSIVINKYLRLLGSGKSFYENIFSGRLLFREKYKKL